MYLSRQPPRVCEIASQQAKAANYTTLRSISFFFPSTQLHKVNPAVRTSTSRWHHLLSEETEFKVSSIFAMQCFCQCS